MEIFQFTTTNFGPSEMKASHLEKVIYQTSRNPMFVSIRSLEDQTEKTYAHKTGRQRRAEKKVITKYKPQGMENSKGHYYGIPNGHITDCL
jgi:hypothetical protein